jgi:predicted ATP-binding protein involved in virulence
MGDPDARFVWGGRHYAQKIAIESGSRVLAPGLDALSGGQASLLSIFGTILRYGDNQGLNLSASEIEGVCVIDEVDAHMHVDQQINALPQLISMFPRVQFLLSGHSPLFAMGLEQKLGSTGVRFIEMPSGSVVAAEA